MRQLKKELASLLHVAGYSSAERIVSLVEHVIWSELREEFESLLWDESQDTDVDYVLGLFDRAVTNLKGKT